MASRDFIRRAIVAVTPPILLAVVRRYSGRKTEGRAEVSVASPEFVAAPAQADPVMEAPEWEAVGNSASVWEAHEGWTHESIVQLQLKKWPSFLQSLEQRRSLGQSHEAAADAVADFATHNTLMTFGYVLGRAAAQSDRLSILDWGGGLGHYYLYSRTLRPDLTFDYTVMDFPRFCEAGRALLPAARFLSESSQALSRSYDFVFASSSLQYERDLYGLLARLCDAAEQWLMITRTPIVERSDDFVVVQRPYVHGYMTEYPGWFINRHRLTDYVESRGFVLERQFLVAETPYVPSAPEAVQYYGFLFRRTSSESVTIK